MAKCERCYHNHLCGIRPYGDGSGYCNDYKDKSLIVELPCKIGTPVYIIVNNFDTYEVHEVKFDFSHIDNINVDVFLDETKAEMEAYRRNNGEILYRSEEVYGSGVRDIVEVMKYETFELGNLDILDYLYIHYRKAFGDVIACRIKGIYNDLNYYGYDSNDIKGYYTDEKQTEIFTLVIDKLNKYYGVNLKYCLWLADETEVVERYKAAPESVDAYRISNYILSDLSKEGKLFAYEELPEPIKERKD